mmetsp:Transcript_100608/g.323011  ORF Transcript_100608/g.323011 Transcript_100608/m.323011 type:complete len:218 (-) Transcript_100608:413-1066(-)
MPETRRQPTLLHVNLAAVRADVGAVRCDAAEHRRRGRHTCGRARKHGASSSALQAAEQPEELRASGRRGQGSQGGCLHARRRRPCIRRGADARTAAPSTAAEQRLLQCELCATQRCCRQRGAGGAGTSTGADSSGFGVGKRGMGSGAEDRGLLHTAAQVCLRWRCREDCSDRGRMHRSAQLHRLLEGLEEALNHRSTASQPRPRCRRHCSRRPGRPQ